MGFELRCTFYLLLFRLFCANNTTTSTRTTPTTTTAAFPMLMLITIHISIYSSYVAVSSISGVVIERCGSQGKICLRPLYHDYTRNLGP